MQLDRASVLITGGGGFIGSHLSEHFLEKGATVRVLDNFSHGERDWVPKAARVIEGDCRDRPTVEQALEGNLDLVIHTAAGKDVNHPDPIAQYAANHEMTQTLLDTMDEIGPDNVAFTSSSTVYGEAPRPTPEDYAPLEPISHYGAGKLAEEALCSVYGHSKGFRTWTFRFANIVGSRLKPGAVIPDFIEKLSADPNRLEILGNGRQEKSYMAVGDCVEAITHVIEATDKPVNCYNLGTHTTTSVRHIADIVADEMGLDPEYEFTGGDRGWEGDVPKMRLDIEKLTDLGWSPSMESDEAVRHCVRNLLEA